MTIFTVHAPPGVEAAALDPAALVVVKEGFSWPALLIPPVWLVWHRQWLVLLIWIVAGVVLSILSGLAGTDASTVVMLLFAFWFALEANGLRRWTLERRGYALLGVVEGRSLEEAERRFFAEAASGDDALAVSAAPPQSEASPPPPTPSPSSAAPSRRPPGPGIVGLFPAPGHRR